MIKPRCKMSKTEAAEPGSAKWRCRIRARMGVEGYVSVRRRRKGAGAQDRTPAQGARNRRVPATRGYRGANRLSEIRATRRSLTLVPVGPVTSSAPPACRAA